MFKKIFIVAIALILLTPLGFADTNSAVTSSPSAPDKKIIAIFLDAPSTYLNNEETQKNIQEKVKAMFPQDLFTVLSLSEVIAECETYRKDNIMPPTQELLPQDIQRIAAKLNCSYALRLVMKSNSPRIEIEFPAVSSVADVTCGVSFLDVKTGRYLVALEIINEGKRAANFKRINSFDQQYDDTIDKALKALEIDPATL